MFSRSLIDILPSVEERRRQALALLGQFSSRGNLKAAVESNLCLRIITSSLICYFLSYIKSAAQYVRFVVLECPVNTCTTSPLKHPTPVPAPQLALSRYACLVMTAKSPCLSLVIVLEIQLCTFCVVCTWRLSCTVGFYTMV